MLRDGEYSGFGRHKEEPRLLEVDDSGRSKAWQQFWAYMITMTYICVCIRVHMFARTVIINYNFWCEIE